MTRSQICPSARGCHSPRLQVHLSSGPATVDPVPRPAPLAPGSHFAPVSGRDLDHVSRLVPAAPRSRVVLVVPGSQPRTQLFQHPYTHTPDPSLQSQASGLPQHQVSTQRPRHQPRSHKPRLPVYLKIRLAPIATGSRLVPMEPGFRPIPAPDLFL